MGPSSRQALLCFCVGLTAWLFGCAQTPEQTVVVYVSVDPVTAQPILDAFTDATGIEVLAVMDTEASKTTGLAQRLRRERTAPRADVFWSSEALQTIELASDGLFTSLQTPALDDWPPGHRDAQRRWYAFSPRPRVLVYAPDRVAPDEIPVALEDLAAPKWQGRLVMADPRFGTTGGHLAAIAELWSGRGDDARFTALLRGLAANQMRLLPGGNAAVVDAVAAGEADIGLTDADDVWAAQRRGLNVAMRYPRHLAPEEAAEGGGTFLMPCTVAVVQSGPNSEAAAQLVEYLLSDEVARTLAQSDSHNVPLPASVAAEFPELAVPDPMDVDLTAAARRRRATVDEAMRVLARGES